MLGGACCVCGYNKYYQGLEIHHIQDKKFNVGGQFNRSLAYLIPEADKCALLCGTCHNELEAGCIEVEFYKVSFGYKCKHNI
jgi:hypothetical protein